MGKIINRVGGAQNAYAHAITLRYGEMSSTEVVQGGVIYAKLPKEKVSGMHELALASQVSRLFARLSGGRSSTSS